MQRRVPFCGYRSASGAARTALLRCRADGDDSGDAPPADRIKATLSGLDALLGIDPEEEAQKKVLPCLVSARAMHEQACTFTSCSAQQDLCTAELLSTYFI